MRWHTGAFAVALGELLAALPSERLAATPGAALRQQQAPAGGEDSLHRPLDQLLDLYVRDGEVYYGALKSARAKLDRYVASLAPADGYDSWPRERQIALWLAAAHACS